MWTTPKKRCPHAHSPNKCNAKEGHISTKEQRRAHLTPEATSSASAEPGHPQNSRSAVEKLDGTRFYLDSAGDIAPPSDWPRDRCSVERQCLLDLVNQIERVA